MIPNSSKTVFVSCLYLNCLYIAFFVCFISSAYAFVASMKCAIVVSLKYNSNREMADVSVLGERWGSRFSIKIERWCTHELIINNGNVRGST